MTSFIRSRKSTLTRKVLSSFIAFTFVFTSIIPPTSVSAQMSPSFMNLPVPGTLLAPSSTFYPVLVKGIEIYPQNPLMFDFIMDTGDTDLNDEEFRQESSKLIKYFLAALTVPEEEMWVNLSPYEKDRIIPNSFGQTEMGRDLLAQDYILKQLAASLMYPEDEIGKEFWKRVYKRAEAKYGRIDIPMNTFNKVWIMPEKASIYEYEKGAFVVDSRLKVMLEEDYLALEINQNSTKHGLGNVTKDDLDVITGLTSEVVREVLLPEIEREVNEGEHFANLRQIYNAMILATWYKKRLKNSLLGQVYVDQKKVDGIQIENTQTNQVIYEQYIEAFKKGVYDYIKEDYDETTQEIIPRKYFSGGAIFDGLNKGLKSFSGDELQSEEGSASPIGKVKRVSAEVDGVFEGKSAGSPMKRKGAVGGDRNDPAGLAQRFDALRGDGRVGVMADGFGKSYDIMNSFLPFFAEMSGVSEEEIRKDMDELSYGEFADQIEEIASLMDRGEIDPNRAANLRLSLSDEGREGEPAFKILYWPMKGDPWQSGHIWMLLEGIRKFKLDATTLFVDNSDPRRKPKLSSLSIRESAIFATIQHYLSPLARYNYFPQQVPDLFTADGEEGTFTLLSENPNQAIALYYGAGSDHANLFTHKKKKLEASDYQIVLEQYSNIWDQAERQRVLEQLEERGYLEDGKLVVKKFLELINHLEQNNYLNEDGKVNKSRLSLYKINGTPDELSMSDIRELGLDTEELRNFVYQTFFDPDVPMKLLNYMTLGESGLKDYKKRSGWQAINVVFSQRKGEEVDEELLKEYENKVAEKLAAAGIAGRMELTTITQPLDVSSTEVRDQGRYWKVPFVMMQLAHAFQMWGFESDQIVEEQKAKGEAIYEGLIKDQLVENNTPQQWIDISIQTEQRLSELIGVGLDTLDKLVMGKIIEIGQTLEGLSKEERSVATQLQNNYDGLSLIRTKLFERSKDIADNALNNPLPLRIQDQALFSQMISDGRLEVPEHVIQYLRVRARQGSSMEVEAIAQDLGVSNELIETILRADSASVGDLAILVKEIEDTGVTVKFGTSGWRGKIGKDFTLPNIRKAAQGTASYLVESAQGKTLIVGHDTRRDNPINAKETASIAAANGIVTTVIKGAVATPVLAYLAQRDSDVGGVVNFTASHNPKDDNGFKFSPSHGGAAADAITQRITELAGNAETYKIANYDEAVAAGMINEMSSKDAVDIYINEYIIPQLKKKFDGQNTSAWEDIVEYIKTNEIDFELILDPMQGTGVEPMRVLYSALAEEAAEEYYTMIHQDNNDPDFREVPAGPRPDKSDSNADLRNAVKEKNGRFGISSDGDADRFGTIDFNGEYVSANVLMALHLFFFMRDSGIPEDVIKEAFGDRVGKTVGTSNFINAVAEYFELPVDELEVGFKWFVEQQVDHGKRYIVSGEESAHTQNGLFAKTWDDGIALGITTLWMVAKTGMSIEAYKKHVEGIIGKQFHIIPGEIEDVDKIYEDPHQIKEGINNKTFETLSILFPGLAEETSGIIDISDKIKYITRSVKAQGLLSEITTDDRPLDDIPFIQEVERRSGQKVAKLIIKDGVKAVLENGSWIGLRPSGTEAKVKSYVEASVSSEEDSSVAENAAEKLNEIAIAIVKGDNTTSSSPLPVGGIDLNANALDLQTSNVGTFKFLVSTPQMIQEMNQATGFVATILHVAPIANLPLILGLVGDEEKEANESPFHLSRLDPITTKERFKARELEEMCFSV